MRQRNFSRDAWTSESRQLKRDSGFEQIRAEVVVCWNLRGTRSSGSGRSSGGELRRWDRPSTGSTDLGCTINISKATLCVDITFGNSFAESPSLRFKLPLAGWRLGECAPCGMLRGPLAPPLEVPCVPCLKVHRY